jgi:DNA-binding response OmpR family regulator
VVIVDDLGKCLEQIFSPSDEGFEVVIIDTHLQNSISSAIELAKTIKEAIPDQKIIVTTTSPLTEVSSKMTALGISKEDLLVKPFELSRLLSLIQTQARMQ